MGQVCSNMMPADSDGEWTPLRGKRKSRKDSGGRGSGGFGGGFLDVGDGKQLHTLLEVFNFCDPSGTGYLRDHERFADVARRLTNDSASTAALWTSLDQDGNGSVSFPEFVEWAELHGITMPVGLEGDGVGPGGIGLPATWHGPRDMVAGSSSTASRWNQRAMVTDGRLFLDLQNLLDVTYKKVWTRDRKATGINKVPDGFELQRAMSSENYSDWKRYYMRRHTLIHDCATNGYFQRYEPLTSKANALCMRHKLRGEACNEWFLFHGTNAASAERICSGDFTMHLSGTATGTLYGKGTYFAESITKADEYAKADTEGNCCVLLCRIAGGRVLYNDEVTPDSQHLQDTVLKENLYHCIIGDREKCRGTFKEYVVFDADQVYVEYVLIYKRRFLE